MKIETMTFENALEWAMEHGYQYIKFSGTTVIWELLTMLWEVEDGNVENGGEWIIAGSFLFRTNAIWGTDTETYELS